MAMACLHILRFRRVHLRKARQKRVASCGIPQQYATEIQGILHREIGAKITKLQNYTCKNKENNLCLRPNYQNYPTFNLPSSSYAALMLLLCCSYSKWVLEVNEKGRCYPSFFAFYSQYRISRLMSHLWSLGKSSPSQAFFDVHFSYGAVQKESVGGRPRAMKAREVI